ncbi:MAG: hypothetical protein H0V76_04520 [Blastocatellia bacterium]|nr:hypothetical protein [Blastocatellia bacterium]
MEEFADVIDHVLTVCDSAAENCTIFPAEVVRVHHSFDDPAAVEGDHQARTAAFRRVRDEIKEYFERDFIPQVSTRERT